MRVVIVRDDITPMEITQPAIFNPSSTPARVARMEDLHSIAASKASDTLAAAKRERDLKLAAAKAASEAEPAIRSQREAENALAKAEAELKELDHAPAGATPGAQTAGTDAAKTKAIAKVEAAKAQLEKATMEAQARREAATRARDQALAAAAAKNIAFEASEAAQHNLSPVSVFISRKTQRLYIRKGNMPVFESPVTIRDPDKPIGTFVFTALDYTRTPGTMRWIVVSMYKDPDHVEPAVSEKHGRTKVLHIEAAPANVTAAQAALARLAVPDDAAAHISEVVLPGSSLIVSDEAASGETGKDTDFIVVMSGEPQGGLVVRHHDHHNRYEQGEWAFWRSSPGYHRSGGFFFFGDD